MQRPNFFHGLLSALGLRPTPVLDAAGCKRLHDAELRLGAQGRLQHKHDGRRMYRRMLKGTQGLPALDAPDGPSADRNVWIWSDLHIGHFKIIMYAERPFENAVEMDEVLYAHWRQTVPKDDAIWNLGDVAMGAGLNVHTWERIASMPGRKKLLVCGNHDLTDSGKLRVDGFDRVLSTMYAPGDPPLVLTHVPLQTVPPGAVNVHGHVHQAAARDSPHINVSVEQIDYRPVRLDRVRKLARGLAAGRCPAGRTTAARLAVIGA